jgi:SAM-dependent methyltransferase
MRLGQLRYRVGTSLPKSFQEWRGIVHWEAMPNMAYLQELMTHYQTKDLVNVDPSHFKQEIDRFLRLRDHAMEGYTDPARQRDLSIQFHWGHDHDFGDFALKGRMGTSHFGQLAAFVDLFQILPRRLDGKRVLDIGCWTGGTSLLLVAMGAHVVAVEEVRKYIECLEYLKHAFKLERLEPRAMSLYDCTEPEFQDSFDFVLFGGVLYHLSDPVLGLRIVFNCLKNGGTCLLSTAAKSGNKPLLEYEGPQVFGEGNKENLSRSGWNYFIPSVSALRQMMADVGFEDIRVRKVRSGAGLRAMAVGTRKSHVDMTRAGLSQRNIR